MPGGVSTIHCIDCPRGYKDSRLQKGCAGVWHGISGLQHGERRAVLLECRAASLGCRAVPNRMEKQKQFCEWRTTNYYLQIFSIALVENRSTGWKKDRKNHLADLTHAILVLNWLIISIALGRTRTDRQNCFQVAAVGDVDGRWLRK